MTLPDALRGLAEASLDQPWRVYLENDYALTISGSSAAFGSNTDLLGSSIPFCDKVTHPSVLDSRGKVQPFIRKASPLAVSLAAAKPDSVYGYYYAGLSAVEFAHPSLTLTMTLTVRAVKIPTLPTLPTQLDKLLTDVHVRLVVAKMAEAATQ